MYDKVDVYIYDAQAIRLVEDAMKNNPAFVQIGNYSDFKYLLMNGKTHANAHGLTVQITEKTRGDNVAPPVLHISGSLRKWYYGALSMNDLTRYDTWAVLTRLADALGIPYNEFRELSISSVEVGLNLDLGNLNCDNIKNRIRSFKDARYKCMDADGYKVFKTGRNSGKVYDKVNETRMVINKMKDRLGVDRFENRYLRKNILRVEFKAYGGANSVGRFLGIRTVDDMVDKYNWVTLQWLRYALKFGFKSTALLPFTPTKKSAKEVTDYIKCRGLLDIGDVELQSILSRLPAQARSDARNAIRTMQDNMPDAVNARDLFRRIATRHFVEHFNRSYRQFPSVLDAAHSPTLL